jgi:hypothetical protein
MVKAGKRDMVRWVFEIDPDEGNLRNFSNKGREQYNIKFAAMTVECVSTNSVFLYVS